MRVFVSGPYSAPDPERVLLNVQKAIDAGNRLIDAGLWPHVPHLMHYMHERQARPYEAWLALDMAWLAKCDAVLRLPGDSPGADREVARARELGLPVYASEERLVMAARWCAGQSIGEGPL